jgi:acyl-CoA thioesterase YciA
MELISTHICKSSDTGLHNNMFGGYLLSLIDEAAVVYAQQLCDTPRMVTVMIDQLIFKKPIKVSNLIKIFGKVLNFGNTSITLYIEVRKHNVYNGVQETVTHTQIKFVKIDEEGNPLSISDLAKNRYYKELRDMERNF